MSKYKELRAINVNDHTEKKGGLTYLSWCHAVDTLLQHDPSATWTYGEPVKWGDTVMVFCTVKAFGKEMTSQLPVMDYRNKAIANPDAMAVNTAMQRCLAKAIALHGIGLYIYSGEDLPGPVKEEKKQSDKDARRAKAMAYMKTQDTQEKLDAVYAKVKKEGLDNEETEALYAELTNLL